MKHYLRKWCIFDALVYSVAFAFSAYCGDIIGFVVFACFYPTAIIVHYYFTKNT